MDFNCDHCKKKLSISNPATLKQIQPNSIANCIYCKQTTRIIPITAPTNTLPPANDATKINPPPQTDAHQYGWIMVHDEHTTKQSFDLRLGLNTIGRKGSKPADILIDTTDAYMSRNHCSITVVLRQDATLSYILQDIGSTNKTYLNEAKLQTGDMLYLQDGDTVQIGRTKVIIKTVTRTATAENVVGKQSFGKTVIA